MNGLHRDQRYTLSKTTERLGPAASTQERRMRSGGAVSAVTEGIGVASGRPPFVFRGARDRTPDLTLEKYSILLQAAMVWCRRTQPLCQIRTAAQRCRPTRHFPSRRPFELSPSSPLCLPLLARSRSATPPSSPSPPARAATSSSGSTSPPRAYEAPVPRRSGACASWSTSPSLPRTRACRSCPSPRSLATCACPPRSPRPPRPEPGPAARSFKGRSGPSVSSAACRGGGRGRWPPPGLGRTARPPSVTSAMARAKRCASWGRRVGLLLLRPRRRVSPRTIASRWGFGRRRASKKGAGSC